MQYRVMRIGDYPAVFDLWLRTPGMGLNTTEDSEERFGRYLRRNPTTCFVAEDNGGTVGVILSLIGTLIGTVDLGNPLVNIFCGLFFGSFGWDWLTGGIFPLFNWFIFVAAGYLFAKYLLRRCENKSRFCLIFSGVSAVVVAIYMAVAIPGGLGIFTVSALLAQPDRRIRSKKAENSVK